MVVFAACSLTFRIPGDRENEEGSLCQPSFLDLCEVVNIDYAILFSKSQGTNPDAR